MAYSLILFDFDGTLADTYPWFAQIMNEVAKRYHFKQLDAADAERLRGLGPQEIIDYLGIPLWKVPVIATHMRSLLAKQTESMKLFPGVPELLEQLHGRGLRLGIVTSNSRENVQTILGPEPTRHIDYFACGASLFGKARKIRSVLAEAKVVGARTLMVGDEVRDAEAARKAQVAFGAVTWGYNTREALSRCAPDRMAETVAELLLACLAP